MNKYAEFGHLEEKPAREYWGNEARDFTPWLAENIGLLGDAIGLDELEVEEREAGVGDFKVDLLCKYGEGHTAIVENQLEKTDHKHLGQLLTYAAGKDAAAVIWVSTSFSDEHRAALDWLNGKTNEDIHFFGVQIEVWKIGNSKAAPRFHVICKPNEWKEMVRPSGEMSALQKFRFEFWSGLHAYMKERNGKVKPLSPSKSRARGVAIHPGGFRLGALVRRDSLVVRIVIRGGRERLTYYRLLYRQKDNLEKQLGMRLEWNESPDKKLSTISRVRNKCHIKTQKNRDELYEWLYEHLEKFHAVFHPRILELEAADWQFPEDEDADEE